MNKAIFLLGSGRTISTKSNWNVCLYVYLSSFVTGRRELALSYSRTCIITKRGLKIQKQQMALFFNKRNPSASPLDKISLGTFFFNSVKYSNSKCQGIVYPPSW